MNFTKTSLRSHVKSEPTPGHLTRNFDVSDKCVRAVQNNTRDFLCVSRLPDEYHHENRRKSEFSSVSNQKKSTKV